MKFAPICPLPLMNDYGASDYHMALAHLMSNEGYAQWFRTAKGYKILDNSAIEKDQPVHGEHLIELALAYGFDELIIPDAPMDAERTIAHVHDYFIRNYQPPIKHMFVPQGSTLEEWFRCLNSVLNKFPWIDTIGLPKNLDKLGEGTRIQVCHMLSQGSISVRTKEWHLLGINNNPVELRTLSQFDWLRGCDSVLPIWLGQHGVKIHHELGLLIQRPEVHVDFLAYFDPFPELILQNLHIVRGWAEYGAESPGSAV